MDRSDNRTDNMSGGLISREDALRELKRWEWGLPEHEVESALADVPTANAVDRDKLLKRIFPMGIPKSRYEWDYTINARAVYEAIMRD